MDGYHEFLGAMALLTVKLKKVCADAGLDRAETIRFVNQVARERGLRRWCDTSTVAEYRQLIAAVREALEDLQ